MAGFDVGGVYYNDPEVQPNDDRDIGRRVNLQAIQRKFEEFLRMFYASEEGQQDYGDALLRDKERLRINYEDIRRFDEGLVDLLRDDPTTVMPLLEAAATTVLASYQPNNGTQQQIVTGVQVLLHSSSKFEGPDSLRAISSEHVSKLVMIPGIITAAANPQYKAAYLMLQCKDCKNTKMVTCKPGMGGTSIPRTCEATIQQTAGIPGERCSIDPYVILPSKSKFIDTQILKMQERPEDIPTGELPRSLTLVVDRQLVGKISPGTRVMAYGIYSVFQSLQKKEDKTGVALRKPYLRIVGLEEESEGAHTAPVFTTKEEREFKEFAQKTDVHANIYARMAPNIFGHESIKKALACLLFGGSRKKLPDGTYRRGDINVLLMGDPSTAKSQFLKFASKTAPIAVYTSGKGSSAAGLTASIIRNPGGEFHLEAGAMVLADNGVVCIDEFDKMRAEDRVAIHEAMEQQTISVAKAGITTMLKSRTSVLAAANPISGRYDDLKTASDNIDLQTTILSRFDLIFIVKDERSQERDSMIARHVLDVHRNAGVQEEPSEEDVREEAFLKRYLEYARTKCYPRLSEQAAAVLADEYVDLREQARDRSAGMPPVPITVRQLEAIVRVSESLARMQLMVEATEAHVHKAIQLFTASTMDAVKSGIVEFLGTEEQKAELHSVEAEIKRRIPIKAQKNVRTLTNELVQVGVSEILIKKALLAMQTMQDIESLSNGRMVRRLK